MLEPQAKLDQALAEAIRSLGADSGTIHLRDSGRQVLHLAASQEVPRTVLEVVREVPWGRGMAGVAAERAEPVTFHDIQESLSPDIHPRERATGTRGVIVVPMMHGMEVVGTIGVGSRVERVFTPGEIDWLLDLGRRLADDFGENRMAA